MITYKAIYQHWHTFDEHERSQHLKERNYSLGYDPISDAEKAQLVDYILHDNFCSKSYPLLLSVELGLPVSVTAFNDAMRNPLAWCLMEKTVDYYTAHNPEIYKVFIASFVYHIPQGFYKDKACTFSFIQKIYTTGQELGMGEEVLKSLLRIRHPFLQNPALQSSLIPLLKKDWVSNRYLIDIFETLNNAPDSYEQIHEAIVNILKEHPEWEQYYYTYFPERGSLEQKRHALLHFWSKDIPPYFQKNELLGVSHNLTWPQKIMDDMVVVKDATKVLENYYHINIDDYINGYCETKKMIFDNTGVHLTIQDYVRQTHDYMETNLHF